MVKEFTASGDFVTVGYNPDSEGISVITEKSVVSYDNGLKEVKVQSNPLYNW